MTFYFSGDQVPFLVCVFCSLALVRCWSDGCQSTTLVQTSQEQWIAMRFCVDISGPQRMNPTDYGDPLTFPPAPPRS